VDYAGSIYWAVQAGLLVSGIAGSLSITDLGERFLLSNPHGYYEIQEKQKSLLIQYLVQSGPFERTAARLLERLSNSPTPPTRRMNTQQIGGLDGDEAACFRLLIFLEFFAPGDGYWYVAPTHERIASHILARSRVTEDEFRKILEDRARFGHAAEVTVVEYERERLRQIGGDAEALLVTRVSEIDVGLGYDIESFHELSKTLRPDRFIEVKASTVEHLRFFWSRNEYETAKRLAEDYFIYYLGKFDPTVGLDSLRVRMIQDPARVLPELPNVNILAEAYLVEEQVKNKLTVSPVIPDLLQM
jgi:hypothetical protein